MAKSPSKASSLKSKIKSTIMSGFSQPQTQSSVYGGFPIGGPQIGGPIGPIGPMGVSGAHGMLSGVMTQAIPQTPKFPLSSRGIAMKYFLEECRELNDKCYFESSDSIDEIYTYWISCNGYQLIKYARNNIYILAVGEDENTLKYVEMPDVGDQAAVKDSIEKSMKAIEDHWKLWN